MLHEVNLLHMAFTHFTSDTAIDN